MMTATRKSRLFGKADRILGRTATAVAVAAGAGVIGFPQSAQAQIVYSGVVSIPIPVNVDGVYINVVTNLTGTTGGTTAGWDINPYSASTLQWFTPSATTHGVVSGFPGGSSATLVDNLPLATLVSGLSAFGSNQVSEATGATAFLLNSDDNYVGFRFVNEGAGGATNFGWMRIHLGASFTDAARAIIGYAYDNTGAGIPVGAVAVPEPSSMALMSLGAAGLAVIRRRRLAKATAAV